MNREQMSVLLVERDLTLARVTRRQLEHLGCSVVVRSTADEAPAVLGSEEIDVILVDDGPAGAALLVAVARERPHIGRLLYADEPGARCEAAEVLLMKPVRVHDLRRALVKVSFGRKAASLKSG